MLSFVSAIADVLDILDKLSQKRKANARSQLLQQLLDLREILSAWSQTLSVLHRTSVGIYSREKHIANSITSPRMQEISKKVWPADPPLDRDKILFREIAFGTIDERTQANKLIDERLPQFEHTMEQLASLIELYSGKKSTQVKSTLSDVRELLKGLAALAFGPLPTSGLELSSDIKRLQRLFFYGVASVEDWLDHVERAVVSFSETSERVGHDITPIRRAFVVIKAVLGWPWLWLLAPEPRPSR